MFSGGIEKDQWHEIIYQELIFVISKIFRSIVLILAWIMFHFFAKEL